MPWNQRLKNVNDVKPVIPEQFRAVVYRSIATPIKGKECIIGSP